MELFKKKKLNYPEEKESVLDEGMSDLELEKELDISEKSDMDSPFGKVSHTSRPEPRRNMPNTQDLEAERENFKQGFVSMEQMAPPREVHVPQQAPVGQAQFPSPETQREVLFPQRIARVSTPHIYIKINKYREVMSSVNELHKKVVEAKKELESVHEINNEEAHKLRETAEVVLKMEDLLRYLETTFTTPEL